MPANTVPPVDKIMRGFPPAPEFRPPTLAWQEPPWNRWAFQRVRELMPTTEVWRGDGPARHLPRAEQPIHQIRFSHAGQERTIAQFLDESYTDGFIVLHRGRIVGEHYMNGMNARSPHLSQSVAKSISATVFGIVAGQGGIDPAAPIAKYLPELEATAYKDARLDHVLDMQSGVAFNEDYLDPKSDVALLEEAAGWRVRSPNAPAATWELVLRLTKLERPHGSQFQYRSIETDVMAMALERATGKRLADLVSEHLWQPMGAEENASFTIDTAGFALADGGFNAVLRDYARFGQLWCEDGMREGKRLIPEKWIARARANDGSKNGPDWGTAIPQGSYAAQWWIEDVADRTLMARGIFGQLIYVDPDKQFVAVKLSTWPEPTSLERFTLTRAAVNAIKKELAG